MPHPIDNTLFRLAGSIRFGFATNSSSSHSILLVSKEEAARLRALPRKGVHRVDPAEPEDEYDYFMAGWTPAPKDLSYGWEWFLLTKPKEKLDYLWANLYAQVRSLINEPRFEGFYSVDPEDPRVVVANLLEEARTKAAIEFTTRALEHKPKAPRAVLGDASIDHDSAFSFPLAPPKYGETTLPDLAFVRWFRDRVVADGVIVVGGNDNNRHESAQQFGTQRDGRPEGVTDVRAPLRDDEHNSPMVAYDRRDHWLLFAPVSGTKLRVPKIDGAPVLFSDIPELVDVKITDQCAMGCTFCYQGSTPKGAHAKDWMFAVEVVKQLGVREVAVGGGEPLESPDFWSMVNAWTGSGIVVNVTTRRLDLIKSETQLSQLGAVGFSCEDPKVLQRALKALRWKDRRWNYGDAWKDRLVVHVVLGATTMENVLAICALCAEEDVQIPVLLLGYKTDGRGADVAPHAHDDWVDQLAARFGSADGWDGPRLGVDTPIVQRWGSEIEAKLEVDPRLMSSREGAFSLYVDFVAQTFSRASYGVDGAEREPFPKVEKWGGEKPTAKHILAAFQRWHQEPA